MRGEEEEVGEKVNKKFGGVFREYRKGLGKREKGMKEDSRERYTE